MAILEGDEDGVPFDFAMRSGSTWGAVVSTRSHSVARAAPWSMHTESMIRMVKCSSATGRDSAVECGGPQAGDNVVVRECAALRLQHSELSVGQYKCAIAFAPATRASDSGEEGVVVRCAGDEEDGDGGEGKRAVNKHQAWHWQRLGVGELLPCFSCNPVEIGR